MNKRLNDQAANSPEAGFSLLAMLFWLVVLVYLVANGYQLFRAYYTDWEVQEVFDKLVETMDKADDEAVRSKMQELFRLKYIDHNDLPSSFYEELQISHDRGQLRISARYDQLIWPLGRVQAVDAEGFYDPDQLEWMDKLRDRTRIELQFEPSAGGRP